MASPGWRSVTKTLGTVKSSFMTVSSSKVVIRSPGSTRVPGLMLRSPRTPSKGAFTRRSASRDSMATRSARPVSRSRRRSSSRDSDADRWVASDFTRSNWRSASATRTRPSSSRACSSALVISTRTSPRFTRWPSSKWMAETVSVTLAVRLTDSLAFRVPSASTRSAKGSTRTSAAITGVGGGVGASFAASGIAGRHRAASVRGRSRVMAGAPGRDGHRQIGSFRKHVESCRAHYQRGALHGAAIDWRNKPPIRKNRGVNGMIS